MNTALTFEQAQSTRPHIFKKIFDTYERLRIRHHLRTVEAELRAKDVSHLSLELQRERERNLDRLHEYWTNEVFPKNLDFPDRRMPYFKDAAGVLCAMAYLIERSGHQDLVNTVARENNHVFINDIHDGLVLEWIERSGLTKAEAARVQPNYGGAPPVVGFWATPGWVIGVIAFIVFNVVSYGMVRLLTSKSIVGRVVAIGYFTLASALAATFLGIMIMMVIDVYGIMSLPYKYGELLMILFAIAIPIFIALGWFMVAKVCRWFSLESKKKRIAARVFVTVLNITLAVFAVFVYREMQMWISWQPF